MCSGDELASNLEAAATKPLLQPIYRLHIEPLETIFNVYVGPSNGMTAHDTSYFARLMSSCALISTAMGLYRLDPTINCYRASRLFQTSTDLHHDTL
jgi:hypothetical protein